MLLVKEAYDRRRYTFPGGVLEPGESQLEAVVRETREEAGVTVAVEHLVGMYRLIGGLTVTLFRCSIRDGTPACPSTGEIAEVGWFEPHAIPEPRSNLLRHALADIIDGRTGLVRDGLARIT